MSQRTANIDPEATTQTTLTDEADVFVVPRIVKIGVFGFTLMGFSGFFTLFGAPLWFAMMAGTFFGTWFYFCTITVEKANAA